MRRLGLSPIVGYLLGGVLIGHHAFGWIHENGTTHLLAELGVVFLLFDIGMHFSVRHIWETRRDIFGLGSLQMGLTLLAFGGGLMLCGFPFEIALVLGGALSLSSTAVVIPTLSERGQSKCPVGRTSTAVLIFQDVFAIFLLILAGSLTGGGGTEAVESADVAQTSLLTSVGLAVVKGAIAFAIAFALGRYAIRPLFSVVARTRNDEIFTALALLIVLAMAAASGWAGLSLTLGAFLGGMMLAETPYRHLIRTEVKPFRGLLLAFFFISIGMSLDWHVLLSGWWQILSLVAAMILIKAIAISASAKIVGWSLPGSMQLGFVLAQGSEFVFVIVSIPAVRAAVGEQYVGVLFCATAISLALTPTVSELGNRLALHVRTRRSIELPKSEVTPIETTAPVVIFRMNEVGRTVADALTAHQIEFTAIDNDYDRFNAATVDGYQVTFGDLADLRMAETISMDQRSVLVFGNIRVDVAIDLNHIVLERFPKLMRIASVTDKADVERLENLGMHAIVTNSENPGVGLAEKVLSAMSVEQEKIDAWIERRIRKEVSA